jgi:hypothetical protein
MTRKDYIVLAKALAEAKGDKQGNDIFPVSGEEMRLDIIGRIARVLQEDNPLFNRDLFNKACDIME